MREVEGIVRRGKCSCHLYCLIPVAGCQGDFSHECVLSVAVLIVHLHAHFRLQMFSLKSLLYISCNIPKNIDLKI